MLSQNLSLQSNAFFANKRTPYFLKKKKTHFKTKNHPQKVKIQRQKVKIYSLSRKRKNKKKPADIHRQATNLLLIFSSQIEIQKISIHTTIL